ncbi:MAG: hypothetical protein ACXW3Z_09205 [Limisphaerales bacterium]
MRVINVHAENLWEITKRLKIDSVEMLILPITNFQGTVQDAGSPERLVLHKSADALVTDARIPREWFLEGPRNESAGTVKSNYPNYFRAAK